LEEHLDRLYWGLEQIRLDMGLDKPALTDELNRLLVANNMQDGVHIRLMVTCA
jgi:branched-chain amino acid aminotransferase